MKTKLIIFILLLLFITSSFAQECTNTLPFNTWLEQFKQDATAQGISPNTVNATLNGVRYDASIIKRDRRQVQFSQNFSTFLGKVISAYRIQKGQKLILQHAKLLQDIENRFGVPRSVLVAFWGLESDFGQNMGNENTIRSLATLAYDCRRTEKFRGELLAALRLIDQGDLTAREMRGAWAGEIGQTQFLPSYYLQYAVDFDGDGKRNLIRSTADALASTANYLKQLGWRSGEPWLEEVVLPSNLPWEQSGLEQSYPISYWASLGLRRADNLPLGGSLYASLLLPMGKDGAAFLVYHNFKNAYLIWNESLLYSTTAAYFATRLSGAKPMQPNRAKIASLTFAQVKTLQQRLVQRGYNVGNVDGIIGENTRIAVKQIQRQLGMPMDGYPTVELLQWLQK
ncbi:MAG: lytic murein transglycosylase [Campylobacterales bacterium]|nr:lytic murein transglycosylase [Campylobacterales bacterium]